MAVKYRIAVLSDRVGRFGGERRARREGEHDRGNDALES